MVAVDHNIARGINLQDSFGDQEAQILFLLDNLVRAVWTNTQDQRVGLVKRFQGTFQLAFLPIILGGVTVVQGIVKLVLGAVKGGVVLLFGAGILRIGVIGLQIP